MIILIANPDGSVGYVPDSLISEFKTSNGRKVYDGGGIVPDIKIAESDISPIARHLYTNMVIFDFATQYNAGKEKITEAGVFSLSNDEFNDFIDFAVSKNISFKTETEKNLDKLIEIAKKEKYFEKVKSEIDNLQEGLKHNVREDILYFKNDIKRLLEAEIVKRYYYRKGAILNSLKDGRSIDKAIEIMNNLSDYNSLLKPK